MLVPNVGQVNINHHGPNHLRLSAVQTWTALLMNGPNHLRFSAVQVFSFGTAKDLRNKALACLRWTGESLSRVVALPP